VYLGDYDGSQVVLKSSKNNQDDLTKEAELMWLMKHPNIVKFLGLYDENGYNYIVMEYLNHGDLLNYICHHKDTPISTVMDL
jgi:serine/threonine protein kinase